MKTFKDLKFEPFWLIDQGYKDYQNHKQAIMTFDNGYSISVLIGSMFDSNGIDTYELAVLYKGEICRDIYSAIKISKISKIMKEVQSLC